MSNGGGLRQPGGADEATTEPGREAPTDDGAALPVVVAAQPDDDAGTESQRTTNAAVLQVLLEGGLTIEVRGEDDKFREIPIGRAVKILLEQRALTEDMARDLKTIYELAIARIGGMEQSPEHRSILEAIQRGTSESQEKNPFYGYFSYAVDLRGRLTEVSIIEAIAFLKYEGRLSPAIADYLKVACMENMRRTPYRKTLNKNLTPEEIEEELADLKEKAWEITDPTNDIAKIAELEAQLDEGDFTFNVDWSSGKREDVGLLAGIFYHRKDGELNTGPAIRLAKKCINELSKHGHGRESIISKIEWIHGAESISDDELRELLGCIITDPDELAQRIGTAVDLSLDGLEDEEEDAPPIRDDEGRPVIDGPPVPAAFVDTSLPEGDTGPFSQVTPRDIIGVGPLDHRAIAPDVARARRGLRLVLAAFGLLAIASGAAEIVTSAKRAVKDITDTTVAVGIASTETGEAEAPALKPIPTPAQRSTPSGPTPAPAAQAATPATTPAAPQATPDDPVDAHALVPLAPSSNPPRSITVPVTIKQSSSGSLKIDTTDEARAEWVNMGLIVSVSMGLNGKIIRLTDSRGNVYQVATENLTADTTTLQAILRSAE